MEHTKLAKDILDLVGGEKNVKSAVHCMTRLRLTLYDNALANRAKLEKINGVMGTNIAGGQFQVILGNKVSHIHKEFVELLGGEGQQVQSGGSVEKKKIVDRFLDTISGIFAPILPAIIGAGLLKGIIISLTFMNAVSTKSDMYQLLTVFSDAAFYFLPILLAFSAAKRFQCNQYVAGALAGVLVHPSLVAIMNKGIYMHFLGLPIKPSSYASSVLPIILGVWLMSYVEKGLIKVVPQVLRTILVPLLTLLITAPVVLVALGPVGTLIGNGLGAGFIYLYSKFGILAGVLLGGFYPFIVLTGMHIGLMPVMLQSLSKYGVDYIMGIGVASNSAQAGATLAIYLKTKNTDFKAVAGSAALNATIGITEPALFGVTSKLKRPLIAVAIAGALGGGIMGAFKVGATGLGTGPLAGIPLFFGATFIYYVIGCVVSYVVAFILTSIIGFEDIPVDVQEAADEFDQKEMENRVANDVKPNHMNKNQEVYSPIHGKTFKLTDVNDAVFSKEMMGKGIAIEPVSGRAVSPVNGVVATIFNTKHAIGIIADDGAEILIHIGIDTVQLGGKYFTSYIKEGDKVKVGDLLVEFDIDKINEAGYQTVTPIIVTNTAKYTDIATTGSETVKEGDPLLSLITESEATREESPVLTSTR